MNKLIDSLLIIDQSRVGYIKEKSALPVTKLNFGGVAPGGSSKLTLG